MIKCRAVPLWEYLFLLTGSRCNSWQLYNKSPSRSCSLAIRSLLISSRSGCRQLIHVLGIACSHGKHHHDGSAGPTLLGARHIKGHWNFWFPRFLVYQFSPTFLLCTNTAYMPKGLSIWPNRTLLILTEKEQSWDLVLRMPVVPIWI